MRKEYRSRVGSPVSAMLFDAWTGLVVEASILHKIASEDFRRIEDEWGASKRDFRKAIKQQGGNLPENDSWDWKDKAATATSHRFLGVATDGIQGMMMLATDPQSSRKPDREGEQMLYIEYLESAPWNLSEYAGNGARYRGVGTALLNAAVTVSIIAGCNGRLALHSLPGACRFYEKAGFERVSFDEAENLDWFELERVSIAKGASNGPG